MLASRHVVARAALRRAAAKTSRSLRRIFPSMCCRPTSCASIPRTGNSFCTARSIVRSRRRSAPARASHSSSASCRKIFHPTRIHEALKRLTDRRFVVTAPKSSAAHADVYWASLGLLPADAEKNLQTCRVRIQSVDVQGATELGAALKALGVRVVRGPADLTVTLVSDYLEARLAELNRQHLSDRTPWLLVQPSGIFPLVGPVFRPGKRLRIRARAPAGPVSPRA